MVRGQAASVTRILERDGLRAARSAKPYGAIDALLSRASRAAQSGRADPARAAALGAYSLFERGPARRLQPANGTLVSQAGADLWAVVEATGRPADIVGARNSAEADTGTVATALGDTTVSRATVVADAGVIVFREGLEAVLILAAITASFTGNGRRRRLSFSEFMVGTTIHNLQGLGWIPTSSTSFQLDLVGTLTRPLRQLAGDSNRPGLHRVVPGLKVTAVRVDGGLTSFAPARSYVMSEPPATSTSSSEQHDNRGPRLADASVARTREMELCVACGSRLVHPVSWEETPGGFAVLLRCPDCLVHVHDEFSDAELERYDAVLDEGARVLIADLKMLACANMKEYVRRFSSALHAGHIQPEDF